MKNSMIGLLTMLVPVLAAMPADGHAASTYPNKPIRLIVPFSPGGPTDIICRIVANKLSAVVGQSVVVENRDGAGGAIGARVAAGATPDGYTLFCGSTSTLAILPSVKKNLGYDPVKSFTPVALTGSAPLVMVASTKRGFKSVADLMAFAKSQPGVLNYGSAGVGTPPHIAGELFKSITGLDVTHIPYKGAAPAFNEVMAGQIDLIFAATSIMSAADPARVTPLLVTARTRSKSVPNVPSAQEAGLPNLTFSSWNGVVAPKGVPQPIVNFLNKSVNAAITDPEVARELEKQGYDVEALDADQFEKFVRSEVEKVKSIVSTLGSAALE